MIMDALNQLPVDKLPLRMQAMYALLLNRVQNGIEIHMGPFRELNYTAVTWVRISLFAFEIPFDHQ